MKTRKLLGVVLSLLLTFTAFCGCGQKKNTEIAWSDGYNAQGRYDSSLFYSNDFESVPVAPDPYIFYEDGWFYLYSTEVSGGILVGYRSRNLANWEYLGAIYRRASNYWEIGRAHV